MTKEDFVKKYCNLCGSQMCFGIEDKDFRDGCTYYKEHFEEQKSKKSKIQRVYEDDTWVIDLINGNVRVSYFEDGHFVDEIVLSGDDFKEE